MEAVRLAVALLVHEKYFYKVLAGSRTGDRPTFPRPKVGKRRSPIYVPTVAPSVGRHLNSSRKNIRSSNKAV